MASAIWLIANRVLKEAEAGEGLFPDETAEQDAFKIGKATKHMIGYLRLIRRKHEHSKQSKRIDTLKAMVKFDKSYWTENRLKRRDEQACTRNMYGIYAIKQAVCAGSVL